MNERTSNVWVVTLVAFAGLFHFVPASTAPETKVTRPPADAAQLSRPRLPESDGEDAELKLLANHYFTPYTRCTGSTEVSQIDVVTKVRETRDVNTTKITKEGRPRKTALNDCLRTETIHEFQSNDGQAIVALLPDPIDGHATYRFDEEIEALQTAAQDSGYLLDRFLLPWARKPMGGNDTATPPDNVPRFRERPGVMIFRGKDFPRSSLVVFLVGEIPTRGVQQIALANALTLAHSILGTHPGELKIIGPNFSGSVASIRATLSGWSKSVSSSTTLNFISGNATAIEARQSLQGKFGNVEVQYHATVLPDNVIQCAIADYFQKAGLSFDKVAALVEADSAYGEQLLRQREGFECKKEGSRIRTPPAYRYQLPYPLQISQVRTQYQKEVTEAQPVSIAENPTHAALHLSTDDAEDPLDKPQPYSLGPSANIAELSLTAIMQTLNREHINYVGIFGTDTRDKLFLARLIRSYFPNIQFFTDDAEILYLHPEYTADLWGMLIFSTYPLVSQNATWIRNQEGLINGNKLRQFTSQTSQSVYNAMRLAAGRLPLENEKKYWMVKNPLIEGKRALLDYYPPLYFPQEFQLPVVWTTAVGNGTASNGL